MDIEKARAAHLLYAERDNLKSSVLTMKSRMEKGPGTTTVRIPTSWLPAIINIDESELERVNQKIESL